MYINDAAKVILVTNNSMAIAKYGDVFDVRTADSYEDVLIKTRDLIYAGCMLLTHPQASSLKPNQTPVRSVMLYPERLEGELAGDCVLIDNALEGYSKWQHTAPSPSVYPESIINDFETIDLSLIDGVAGKMDVLK